MSDRSVNRALEESIAKHEQQISRKCFQQNQIVEEMSGANLYMMTHRYRILENEIGEHRQSIRDLKKAL